MDNKEIFLAGPDVEKLKIRVLGWTTKMRISPDKYEYKFSCSSGYSLFTSCFALFILDLFKETDNLSDEEKQGWAKYINSFQKKDDGLFYPSPIYHPDKERAVFQCSCFCLSALSILNEEPKHRLSIVDKWKSEDAVEKYLLDRKCHLGVGGSGNKAMFQAIFLTREYEKTKDEDLRASMEAWFRFHNKHQNKYGFWGKGFKGRLYGGLQNAFHQYVIYEYWNREYPRLKKVSQTAIEFQDNEGFFAPYPGGSSCQDYDVIHFLLASPKVAKNEKGKNTIKKVIKAFDLTWNDDGGFCDNHILPLGSKNIIDAVPFILKGGCLFSKIYRAKKVAGRYTKYNKKFRDTKWVESGQPWHESTLWSTWFRCLALAKITSFFKWKGFNKFRFHNHVGLGFKKSQSEEKTKYQQGY